MADKDDDFDTKNLQPERVADEIEKEDAVLKAEQERQEKMEQAEDKSLSGDDYLAQPLPEPRPGGDMELDANEVMRRTEEARWQEKVNRHLDLHDQKEEIRQRENGNVNIREDFEKAQER